MRTFTALWLSSLISAIGSSMAGFAVTLWVWDLTGSATALVLTGFFYKLPIIVVSVFAGTRVPLQTFFDYLEGEASIAEFLEDFPHLRS